MTVTDVLREGYGVLFCPACGNLREVYRLDKKVPYPVDQLTGERCPICWKAFLEVVEPKA